MLSCKPLRVLSLVALCALALAGAIGGAYFLRTATIAEAGGGLLQLADLPPAAQLLNEGPLAANDPAHPLSTEARPAFAAHWAAADEQLLFSYLAVRSFSALLPVQGVIISNFTYEYAAATTAAQASKLLQSEVQNAKTLQASTAVNGTNGWVGWRVLLRGAEGDSVYWFIGSRDKTLVLLLVNGMQPAAVISTFESTLKVLLSK